MAGRGEAVSGGQVQKIMSAFHDGVKSTETLEFAASDLGQNCPRHCPEHCPQVPTSNSAPTSRSLLGKALGIAQVAEVLGCSEWTVRHKYLRHGLPHVRASSGGKIVFFRGQVIAWIVKQQQKGGRP